MGLAPSTLGYWLRTGALDASDAHRPGEATMTFASVVETHMLRQLRLAGLSLQAIRDAAIRLRADAHRPHPLAWRRLVDILRAGSRLGSK